MVNSFSYTVMKIDYNAYLFNLSTNLNTNSIFKLEDILIC